MKYEWMSRWKVFLGGIIIVLLMNIHMVSKIATTQDYTNNPRIFAIYFLIVFAMGVVLFVDHIKRIYNSLFREEGYFLFTTPLNGYEILGAKMATIIFECIGLTLFAGVMGYLDSKIIFQEYVPLEIPSDFIFALFKLFTLILLGYLTMLLMIYLSMALVKSIFSTFKYGKLLSFGFFILISKIVEMISSGLNQVTDYGTNLSIDELAEFNILTNEYFILNICILGSLFILTGYLFDRKINI